MSIQENAIPLHQVFHGIRFKVNKGWVKALTLFLYLSSAIGQHNLIPESSIIIKRFLYKSPTAFLNVFLLTPNAS